MDNQAETFTTWGIVEVLGRRRFAGKLSEATIAGGSFLRLDAPQPDGTLRTSYYGSASIYAIHPSDEATARAVAAHHQEEPVARWELLPPGPAVRRTLSGDELDDAGPF